MTVLHEILQWSQDRPAWQREALRRLVLNGELVDEDISALAEICKSAHGLAELRDTVPLAKEHVPDQSAGAPVSLVSIFHHRGVNALAEDQTLKFGPGLTRGKPLCVTLHLAAGYDAEELLIYDRTSHLADAILSSHAVILAAAIGEPALRNYLRNLLINLFGYCDELDDMIDVLIEMFKRGQEMPVNSTAEYLDSWWDDWMNFPPIV